MVGDHALVAAGDEDEMLDPRLARLVDHILQRRAVDDGQHFLRHGLGGGRNRVPRPAMGNTALRRGFTMRPPFHSLYLCDLLPFLKGPIETLMWLSVMSVLVTGGAVL